MLSMREITADKNNTKKDIDRYCHLQVGIEATLSFLQLGCQICLLVLSNLWWSRSNACQWASSFWHVKTKRRLGLSLLCHVCYSCLVARSSYQGEVYTRLTSTVLPGNPPPLSCATPSHLLVIGIPRRGGSNFFYASPRWCHCARGSSCWTKD